MADWTPTVGDRVTVAGDDREWVVSFVHVDGRVSVVIKATSYVLVVLPSMLSPVPTPPPEPPKYVRYANHLYSRESRNDCDTTDAVLIDPADPAQVKAAGLCRADEVNEWLLSLDAPGVGRLMAKRFGGGDA